MSLMKVAIVAIVVAPVVVASAAADNAVVPRVAFFGFHLINTSLEPTTPAESERVRMLGDLFREKLDASGRFKIVSIPPDLGEKIAAGPEISSCNGCERAFAQKLHADCAGWGTLQKVSNLILNINVYMENVQAGKIRILKRVVIRSNTAEARRV